MQSTAVSTAYGVLPPQCLVSNIEQSIKPSTTYCRSQMVSNIKSSSKQFHFDAVPSALSYTVNAARVEGRSVGGCLIATIPY